MSRVRWGVVETDFSVHIIPCTVDRWLIGKHEADVDCYCEPLVDPETFSYPRCLYVHNLMGDEFTRMTKDRFVRAVKHRLLKHDTKRAESDG